jgi:hypothetical protein
MLYESAFHLYWVVIIYNYFHIRALSAAIHLYVVFNRIIFQKNNIRP